MNTRQILNISRFVFIRNIKKMSYWTVLIWPITLILCSFLFYNQTNSGFHNFNVSFFLCALSLFITFFLGHIIGNELVVKKTSKVNEYLASFVKTSNLFWGKVIGIIYVFLLSICIYTFIGYSVFYYLPSLNIFQNLISSISINNLVLLALNIFILTTWIIIFAAFLGIYSRNEKHLSQKLFYLYFYILIITTCSIKLGSIKLLKIFFNFIPVFSQFNFINLNINNHSGNLLFLIVQILMFIFAINFAKNKYNKLFIKI